MVSVRKFNVEESDDALIIQEQLAEYAKNIGLFYGPKIQEIFLDDLERSPVLAEFLMRNGYVSKNQMINHLVLRSLLKGTRYEDGDLYSALRDCVQGKHSIVINVEEDRRLFRDIL